MVFFHTDADRAASGEFLEATVSLADEYTLPACTITRFRWPFPTVSQSPVPYMRVWIAGVDQYPGAGGLPFDTTNLDAWNFATPGSPLVLAAPATVRVTVVVQRYPAVSGFFSGGSVTRNGITATTGRFASGDANPASSSSASFLTDIDVTFPGIVSVTGSSALGALSAAGTVRRRTHMTGSTALTPPVAAGELSGVVPGRVDNIGGWWGLLAIQRSSASEIAELRRRVPVACPNDGEPLLSGPGGVLYCRYDGWQYPRDYVRP